MQLLCRQYASYTVSLIKGDNNCNSKTATDGGGIKQQRCFLVYKKLDVKQLYTDVQLFNIAARPDWKTWVD